MNRHARAVRRSLKTGVVSILVLMLLCSIVAVEAQTPDHGEGNANIIAQNVSDTSQASVVAQYLDPDGTTADSVGTSIDPLSAKEFLASDTSIGSSWVGSMVLYSDNELASVANLLFDGGAYGDGKTAASYTGFGATSDTWYLPGVSCSHGIRVSQIAVQNADTEPADVVITFYYLGDSTPTATINETIEAGGSRYYDLGSPGGNVPDLAGLIGESRWNGSAVIEASDGKQITAVCVTKWKKYAGAYVGATAPSTDLIGASIARRAYEKDGELVFAEVGSVSLQNPGDTTATVDVAFYDATTGALDLLIEDYPIPGHQFRSFHTRLGGENIDPSVMDALDRDPGTGVIWNGRVVVQSDIPILGVMSKIRRGEAATLYNMVAPTEGSGVLYAPTAYRVRSGGQWTLYTRIGVANLSSSVATVDYYLYDRNGNMDLHVAYPIAGDAAGGINLKQSPFTSLGNDWIGSVYMESDQPVIAIVDTLWSGRFSTYNAINH